MGLPTMTDVLDLDNLGSGDSVDDSVVSCPQFPAVPGDYLEVEARQGKLILTPKTLIEKEIKKRLAEGLEDIRTGRVTGPFQSAKELVRSLHSHKVTRRRKV